MDQAASEIDYWARSINWYLCESREVLAAVGIGRQMADGRVGEENQRNRLVLDKPAVAQNWLDKVSDIKR